jgi:hypothetical protein
MKKFKVTALVVALAMLFALPAWSAAKQPTIGKSSIEIEGVTISYNSLTQQKSSGSQTTYGIGAALGYFLTDVIEVGVGLWIMGGSSNLGGGATSTGSEIDYLVNGRYNFHSGKLIPYLEIKVFGNSASATGGLSTSGFGYGAGGGLRYLIVPDASINLALGYETGTSKPSGGSSITRSDLGISAGMSIFLGGKK